MYTEVKPQASDSPLGAEPRKEFLIDNLRLNIRDLESQNQQARDNITAH
jgi:hypothetical protein